MIHNIPTNIITGFLGAGKTSAILHLLQSKPSHERWAILINEFGEIGVDGSLFTGQHKQSQGVFIREVPGGCMCCTAGLPMQVALNQLLLQAKPDRLLIEPTGLGHPKEILESLSASQYKDILNVEKTLTLVDARKLSDTRYTSHDTFNQQITIADVIVGNKQDLYQESDKANLIAYVQKRGRKNTELIFTEQAKIDFSVLQGETTFFKNHSSDENKRVHTHHEHSHGSHEHGSNNSPSLADMPIPECGFVKAVNQGDGYKSMGWRFSPEVEFNYRSLFTFLSGITAERMKAVFITDEGVFGYNLTTDALNEAELDDCWESKIEIIATELDDSLENQLMTCIQR